jgi:hypothetical protein
LPENENVENINSQEHLLFVYEYGSSWRNTEVCSLPLFLASQREYILSNLVSIKKNGSSSLIEDPHASKAPRNRLRF